MVVNAVLNIVAGAVSWVLGLMPHLAVPAFITTAGTAMTSLTSGLSGTTGWLPWTVVEAAIALALGALALSVVIRGIRIAASFLTLGGGS